MNCWSLKRFLVGFGFLLILKLLAGGVGKYKFKEVCNRMAWFSKKCLCLQLKLFIDLSCFINTYRIPKTSLLFI
jgi:hypothetical protein